MSITKADNSQALSRVPSSDPAFEIDWGLNDPENPKNWPVWYRGFIVGTVSFSTTCVLVLPSLACVMNRANTSLCSVLYSTSYTSGVPGVQKSFNISDRTVTLLGLTTYLLGLALGCLVLAPMSEMYGRRPIYLFTSALFTLLILPVALAPNFAAVLASRAFCGFFGSPTIVSAPGTVSDIISSKHRALAFSLWSLGAMNGPVLGTKFT